MVLQSTSSQDVTLSELLMRLEEDASSTADSRVQCILAAGKVLLAAPARERRDQLRHHCCVLSIPIRVEGTRALRPVKDLCADLSEVLRRKASDVLRSAGSCASEHVPMQASSSSEYLFMETKSDHADSDKHAAKRARQQEQTSASASSAYGSVVEVDGLRGILPMQASSSSEHLFMETKRDHADSDKHAAKRARQQEQTSASASAAYDCVVEVDGLRGILPMQASSSSEHLFMETQSDHADSDKHAAKRARQQEQTSVSAATPVAAPRVPQPPSPPPAPSTPVAPQPGTPLLPSLPPLIPVPPDGYCFYHVPRAAQNPWQWLVGRDARGFQSSRVVERSDSEAAKALRQALIAHLRALGQVEGAERLGKPGSEGFPGNEHLPHLAAILGRRLELGSSDGSEVLESFGDGPLLARFVYQTVADAAGHESGHWVLARPGLGPAPSRGERSPSPPLLAAPTAAEQDGNSEPLDDIGGGGAEHTDGWKEILASVEGADKGDSEAQRIKAAVEQMQNLTGRTRKQWVRMNAALWGVQRRQGRQGKYTDGTVDQLQDEIKAKIQVAWKKWSSQSGSSASVALKRRRTSRGEDGQTRLFSTEDTKAKAALEWLHNQSGQSTADALLTQIAAWDEVLAGDCACKRAISLAKSHKIAVPRASRNSLRDGKDYQIIRDHFLNAISQERGRVESLAPLLRPVASRSAAQHTLTMNDVMDFPSLNRFAQQQQELAATLRQIIRNLNGGVIITTQRLTSWAKELGFSMVTRIDLARTHTRNDITPEVTRSKFRFSPQALKRTLQLHCYQRVATRAAGAVGDATTAPGDTRTALSLKQLAATLRNPAGRATCPFGKDFMQGGNELAPRQLADLKLQLVHLLALMELHQDGYRYVTTGSHQKALPLPFTALAKKVREHRAAAAGGHDLRTVETLASALQQNPVLKDPLGWWMLSLFTGSPLTEAEGAHSISTEGTQNTSNSNCILQSAERISSDFLEFVGKHELHEAVLKMTSTQVQVVAMFHAQLKLRPPKRVQLTERWEYLHQKPSYVSASEVQSPDTPHFAAVADAPHGPAVLQAPVVCQLCGLGFLSRQALWKHCELHHHSWCEYRKRLIFEVQQRNAVPLRPVEKRRFAGNYMQDLLYSRPGRGTVKPNECTMRQVVACAVCAVKDWIDDYYPCYLWQESPVLVQSTEQPDNEDHSEAEAAEEEEEHQQQRQRAAARRGPELRGEDGFCFLGPAEKIHKLLDVDNYVPVVPCCPLEELHASSVQHPRFPHTRWLLHTKRVPVKQDRQDGSPAGSAERAEQETARTQEAAEHMSDTATGGAAAPDAAVRPPCAGVGDPEQTAWLCNECAAHLCRPDPKMPPQALANWNWGGRQHPLYKDLTMATRMLLGLGRAVMRLVLLKPRDKTDEVEKGLVGNTILVAQPAPQQIISALPPSDVEQVSYFNVVYNTGREELGKKAALTVNRAQYLACARIRAARCPLFATISIDEAKAEAHLPTDGVPPGVLEGAVEMHSIEHFAPNLSGPASRQAPFSKSGETAETESDAGELEEEDAEERTGGCSREPDALIAEENMNAEYLIGLDESPEDCSVAKLAAFRAKLRAISEHSRKLATAVRRQVQATDAPEAQMEFAADAAAAAADHRSVCVDLRTLAKRMGTSFQEHDGPRERAAGAGLHVVGDADQEVTQRCRGAGGDPAAAGRCRETGEVTSDLPCFPTLWRKTRIVAKANRPWQQHLLSGTLSSPTAQEDIEAQVAATQRTAATPATLKLTSGAPLSFFDPGTWVACFVEFFYGDCAPNLDRPVKIGWRRLFRYLMNREELEYHLRSDKNDPAIPGGRYIGATQSRWNTPEFAAVFVDTVRKLDVLQSTKGFFTKHAKTFAKDLRLIAKATDKDFEKFQANLRQEAMQGANVAGLISAAKQQEMPGVQKVLQHLLMHTTNVAMTEGNKMTIRHMGQAMNLRCGPFSSFFTTNFADTYNPLTVVLHQGAGEPLGPRAFDIRQDSPPMPTSQEMHKMVAAHPMTQANLFLLLDALTHIHLLCVRNAFLGRRKYDPTSHWQREPPTEDDFASTGDCGIAGLVRSLVKALEAQGRGFAHGHQKLHSEPLLKAIDLLHLILNRCNSDGVAEHVLQQWARKHREDCLDDAATKQYDSSIEGGRQFGVTGLQEIFTEKERVRCRLDGGCEEDGRLRELVQVVPEIEPAHLRREREAAIAEGRPLRHAYREMPLTGAPGARHPSYLLPRNYLRFSELDDSGHASETLLTGSAEHGARSETGWLGLGDVYVLNSAGEVCGFRKPDGTMAIAEEHQADAVRYARNFSFDARMCHSYNHTHDCKATCFKYSQTKPSQKANQDTTAAAPQRQSCRFRFWRVIEVGGKFFRRLGKALVAAPCVAHHDDDNNEYGRCIVRRHNCFRGSSNDVCQVVLRCNVDLQYQVRTFPEQQQQDGATDHTTKQERITEQTTTPKGYKHAALPRLLQRLGKKVVGALALLVSAAIAMRSSHVSDFYATKYLAKPQQWLHSVLGPLIQGFRRAEEKMAASTEEKPTTYQVALRKVRTAIFAANRSIWISSCEAALFLQTGGTAVFSHADVPVHARRGLFMMHECKRMLNKEVAGSGLWEARLPDEDNEQSASVVEVIVPDQGGDSSDIDDVATTEQQEQCPAIPEAASTKEDADVEGDVEDRSEADPQARNCPGVQMFQVTISVRDDWLHRGPALHDMDLNTYVSHVVREEKALLHAAMPASQRGLGPLVPFDHHYKLAANYAQRVQLRPTAITRYVGPNCERETVNEGEENAAYKAFHCSLLRCLGPEQCADPLMCKEALPPRFDFEHH